MKQRGFFDHRNYIEKSTWKHRGYFEQRNYTEKSTWKRRGFFDQRDYIEKVHEWRRILSKFALRRNDIISTWNRRRFKVVCPLGCMLNEFLKMHYGSIPKKEDIIDKSTVKIWKWIYVWINVCFSNFPTKMLV